MNVGCRSEESRHLLRERFALTKFRRDLYARIEGWQHHPARRRSDAEYDSLKSHPDQPLDRTLLRVHECPRTINTQRGSTRERIRAGGFGCPFFSSTGVASNTWTKSSGSNQQAGRQTSLERLEIRGGQQGRGGKDEHAFAEPYSVPQL
jgi:hypothetical protein